MGMTPLMFMATSSARRTLSSDPSGENVGEPGSSMEEGWDSGKEKAGTGMGSLGVDIALGSGDSSSVE